MRNRVFICYSNDDSDFVDQLRSKLNDRTELRGLKLWSDHDIPPGSQWAQQISKAISDTCAAVLCVSESFLTSEFIQNHELPRILPAARTMNFPVLCIAVQKCNLEASGVGEYQFVNDTGFPVSSFKGRDRDFEVEKLANRVARSLPALDLPRKRHNYFTGRDNVLSQIRESFVHTPVHVICGLGGMGKTETAVEFCYRHGSDYQSILWTSESEGLARFGRTLEVEAQDAKATNEAVIRWLKEHNRWLLVLDQVLDCDSLTKLLPEDVRKSIADINGNVLVTSRKNDDWPSIPAKVTVLDRLSIQEASSFLQTRTCQPTHRAPDRLCEALGCLPLALEHAGAYIIQTGTNFQSYLEKYNKQGIEVFRDRDENIVARTWEINFAEVNKTSGAGDALRLSAFLASDAIPVELLTYLDEDVDSLLRPLYSYSLVSRRSGAFDMHPLVQEAIRARMKPEDKVHWAEQAMLAVNKAFPEVTLRNWPTCERLLPHARLCATLISGNRFRSAEAARLLNELARYLSERAHYPEAQGLYEQAIEIVDSQVVVSDDFRAELLNNLGTVLRYLNRHGEAAKRYDAALKLCRKRLGDEHPRTAQVLNNLGVLHREVGVRQGHDQELHKAEKYFTEALRIIRRSPSPAWRVAQVLNNLGALYRELGKPEEAERHLQQSLGMREAELGPEHPRVAQTLGNLVNLYIDAGRLDAAEPLIRRAVGIRERQLGPKHPMLADLLRIWKRLAEERAKEIAARIGEIESHWSQSANEGAP